MISNEPATAEGGSRAEWSSDQFEAILRSIADGLTVQGADGRLVYANDAALRLLGFGSLDDLLSASTADIMGRFDLSDEAGRGLSLADLPGRQVLRGSDAPPLTVRFRIRATGSERWAIVHASPLSGDNGDVAYVVNTFHDITDRVLAERTNRMQAHLLDQVRASVIATSPDGAITHWNSHAESLFGWSAEAVHGRDISDVLVANGDRTNADRLMARVRGGARWEGEFDVVSRDGRQVPLFVTLAPAQIGDGPAGIVGVAVDITERRRVDAELRATLEHRERERAAQTFLAEASRLLTESLDEDVTIARLARLAVPTIADWCVIDLLGADGTLRAVGIAHVDEARVEVARHLREQYPPDPHDMTGTYGVVRTGQSQLVSPIPPEALAALPNDDIREAVERLQLHAYMAVPLQGHGRALGAITFLSAESGRIFSGDDLKVAEDLAARAAAALENARLYRDVTGAQARLQALAEAEHARAAELHAVIGAMGEAVLVVQPDGRVTLANPAVERLFPGVSISTYGALLDRLDVTDGAPQLGESNESAELRVRGGEERWVELSTWPVGATPIDAAAGVPPWAVQPGSADESGGPGHLATGTAAVGDPRDAILTHRETIVLVRDITPARQRQAVRDTFLGVLSHELRTPITTIFAGAKVLARPNSLTPDARADLFNDISVEAERLHRLVEDVIALNRFGEADGEIGKEPVLLQRILPGVMAAEEPRWPDATFTLDIPPGLPTVTADKTYVEQVVRNLLSNAAKYAGAGAIIRILAESDLDEVRVRVQDNGPGFPELESDRLFELFYRSPATSGSIGGAGIGLFVCARLIQAMGGRMWSALRPRGGAEFGFALRVMRDD